MSDEATAERITGSVDFIMRPSDHIESLVSSWWSSLRLGCYGCFSVQYLPRTSTERGLAVEGSGDSHTLLLRTQVAGQ